MVSYNVILRLNLCFYLLVKEENVNDTVTLRIVADDENENNDEGNVQMPCIFVRDFTWTPHPFDSKDLSFKDLCPHGGPGGLVCCENCTANYSKLMSKTLRNVEAQKMAKIGEEVTELLKFIKAAKRTLGETVCEVRKMPVPLRNSVDVDEEQYF